ncbi:MAG: NAD(P)H-binding protein, partial [Myxococcota bacterium]
FHSEVPACPGATAYRLTIRRDLPYAQRPMARVLIVGAGYLARFLIPILRARGDSVVATTRSEKRHALLESLGAEASHLDLDKPDASPLLSPTYDAVVYSAAPGRGGNRELVFRDAPVSVLERVQGPRLKRFVFTSSIGVYSRTDGSWVDEDSSPRTEGRKAELLEGEVNLLTVPAPVTVLRLGGLYGPDRSPIDWMSDPTRRERIARGNPDGYLNWLRIEDAALAVHRVLTADDASPLYNVVDDEPVIRQRFYDQACQLGGHAPLTLTGSADRGKRVRNDKLKSELGWAPLFETYVQGLSDLNGSGD